MTHRRRRQRHRRQLRRTKGTEPEPLYTGKQVSERQLAKPQQLIPDSFPQKQLPAKMKIRLLRKPAQPDKIFIAGFQNRFGNRNDREWPGWEKRILRRTRDAFIHGTNSVQGGITDMKRMIIVVTAIAAIAAIAITTISVPDRFE